MPFAGIFLIRLPPINLVVAIFLFVALITKATPVNGKICYGIDVRNEPNELETKLRGCTAIIGSLSIVLIEKFNHSHFNDYTFPELK